MEQHQAGLDQEEDHFGLDQAGVEKCSHELRRLQLELGSKILFSKDLEEQVFELMEQKHYFVFMIQVGIVSETAETGGVKQMNFY